MTMNKRHERMLSSMNGYLGASAGLLAIAAGAMLLRSGAVLSGVLLVVLGILAFGVLYLLQPNETAVLTLFGRYVGTDRSDGLRWSFPLYRKHRLSVRARNLNIQTLKVNDKRGNPIEIAAAVVAAALRNELTDRFEAAGVETVDAKLNHLAYAPEIAQVMLRRQQAQAIISARAQIVRGAVGMVEEALKGLAEREIVGLDAERKASMVSNLLVVLCSDRETQPIVNAGTLYN